VKPEPERVFREMVSKGDESVRKENFKFAFIADCQIGMNSPSGLREPGSDKERLDRAIAHINENEVDFLVFGGDQINNRDDEHTDSQLGVLEESLAALTVPYYGVIGNHEQGDPTQEWRYIERGLPVRFALSHGNTFLVGVNSSWLRGDFGDKYVQEEWDYLERRLSEVSTDCKHRFVVMHWPLFNVHPREEDNSWNMPNRSELIELFKRHNVSCILSGHWQQDIDARWHGINLITSVGTSRPLQYPEELSFKVVTVFEEGWSVRRVSVENI
jgi:3',5'-cyclic AMP phosphodiesterase CpdA